MAAHVQDVVPGSFSKCGVSCEGFEGKGYVIWPEIWELKLKGPYFEKLRYEGSPIFIYAFRVADMAELA